MWAAINVELNQANAEQLHDFTGVVLIRVRASFGVIPLAVDHVQVIAHCRVQSDIFEHLAIVAKRVAVQHVHIARHGIGPNIGRHIRDHHNLRQRKRRARTQLICAAQPLLPDGFVAHFFVGTGYAFVVKVAQLLLV